MFIRTPQEKVRVHLEAENWSVFLTQESHREAFRVRDKGCFTAVLSCLPDIVKVLCECVYWIWLKHRSTTVTIASEAFYCDEV